MFSDLCPLPSPRIILEPCPDGENGWPIFTLIGVSVVIRPTIAPGEKQVATDFGRLHQRRMAFAREALLGLSHTLPAWYPRELLGTPFWSNVQNFPFLPTRLLVLFAFDPYDWCRGCDDDPAGR